MQLNKRDSLFWRFRIWFWGDLFCLGYEGGRFWVSSSRRCEKHRRYRDQFQLRGGGLLSVQPLLRGPTESILLTLSQRSNSFIKYPHPLSLTQIFHLNSRMGIFDEKA